MLSTTTASTDRSWALTCHVSRSLEAGSMADQTYRRLGHSTLDVSPVGLGCMGLSGVYGPADDAESITLIHRAIDLCVDHLDSSDMYGWGHNEELIGRALK